MRWITLLLLLAPSLAHAEYKVCGKFLECGLFAAQDLIEKDGETKSIRIFETAPGLVAFISNNSNDPLADDAPFALRFKPDGSFVISYGYILSIGEGSCQNMICQFKIDDSKYGYNGRPYMQISGTIAFANGHILRTELRKSGEETPFFVTGALESFCANEEWRAKIGRPGLGKVTLETCFTYLEMKVKLSLGPDFRRYDGFKATE
ncbi:MAG: hypothetical protein EOP06_06220 [Proteobacteria bacterium]|nr:MAG: hypothetical protein EOP06_06220 [Pseudomonadota bacterium]